ncbi:NUDIX hydrolase [Spelaeicoccus albus]|uniref:8-oxo-dGTP pyrophosphatase MutT (NUDIX family) n=1 Tax=Spelaeicoccus albus TaxID=1280376 RepID=A0A7Z0A9A9_9MICO|nr:CoA pyrophosphatase [Spelaeicoccus albus]NYI65735.1 8-oxo-dGTP pyrophosphatase MutT (NUDIX family) [Spelaeicoccus albus]
MTACRPDPIADAVAGLPEAPPDPRWETMRRVPVGTRARDAAVLMLFGRGTAPVTDGGRRAVRTMARQWADADVLLLQRAGGLRHHAGQVAFPGGGVDAADGGPVDAALREAEEETGVEPAGVDVLGTLTPLYIPPSRFLVTPVLAWWREPGAVHVMDAGESESVHRVAIPDLIAAENRGVFTGRTGFTSPAFTVGTLAIWGFTATLLDFAFDRLGWAAEWDSNRTIDIDVP